MSPNNLRARSSLVASPDRAKVGSELSVREVEAFEDLGIGEESRSA